MAVCVQPSFEDKITRIEDLFAFLSKSPTALSFIGPFVDQLNQRQILISAPGMNEMGRSLAFLLMGTLHASFEYDGVQKKIKLDTEFPLGILAPMFAHEIVHSLDEEYLCSYDFNHRLWLRHVKEGQAILKRVARRTGKAKEKLTEVDFTPKELNRFESLRRQSERSDHIRTFQAEKKAYAVQYAVVRELMAHYPGYRQYLDSLAEEWRDILCRPLSDLEIIENYGLEMSHIVK